MLEGFLWRRIPKDYCCYCRTGWTTCSKLRGRDWWIKHTYTTPECDERNQTMKVVSCLSRGGRGGQCRRTRPHHCAYCCIGCEMGSKLLGRDWWVVEHSHTLECDERAVERHATKWCVRCRMWSRATSFCVRCRDWCHDACGTWWRDAFWCAVCWAPALSVMNISPYLFLGRGARTTMSPPTAPLLPAPCQQKLLGT